MTEVKRWAGQEWEYKIETLSAHAEDTEERLNVLGAEGWEFVQAFDSEVSRRADRWLFRRIKQETRRRFA